MSREIIQSNLYILNLYKVKYNINVKDIYKNFRLNIFVTKEYKFKLK